MAALSRFSPDNLGQRLLQAISRLLAPADEIEAIVAAEQARNYVAYFQKQKTDVNDDDGEPPEYPPMLSATHAALSSIFHELASLACEEIPSQQIDMHICSL